MKTYAIVFSLVVILSPILAETDDLNVQITETSIEVRRGDATPFFRYERPEGFDDQILYAPLPFVLSQPMSQTEGNLPGPFLSSVWRKGGRDSKIVLVFDLSRATLPEANARDMIVHSYISAHGVKIESDDDQLKIVGETDFVDEEAMEYRKEVVTCLWRYRPGTKDLDCRGPVLQ